MNLHKPALTKLAMLNSLKHTCTVCCPCCRYDRDGVPLHFETWKSKAARVLPVGSTMRLAWDKAGKSTDKRTRDRLQMYAAGCAVYVAL